VFRRRRQRRQFRDTVASEVARVAPKVEAASAAVDEDIAATTTALRELPGAAAQCPSCGARMQMRRVKGSRRRWWTMWVCSGCGEMVRPAELPAHRRLGG
jgi:transposase-like protein